MSGDNETPETAAGRSLGSRLWAAGDYDRASQIVAGIWYDIRAIEAEAYEQGLAAAEVTVAALRRDGRSDINYRATLAAIAALRNTGA